MRVTSLRVARLRSIADSGELELGPITLLVGRNNAGKSTMLSALHSLQATGPLATGNVRLGSADLAIEMSLSDIRAASFGWDPSMNGSSGRFAAALSVNGSYSRRLTLTTGQILEAPPAPATEPNYLVVPYLSNRRVTAYEEAIDSARSGQIRADLSNLAAKVDRLSDRNHPRHEDFRRLVDEVIGLPLSAIASPGGKQVGMWVDSDAWIPLSDMGAGVAQMLGLITQLCLARDKLFLIEELENDVHPEALKSLLSVIEEARFENQFVVSTHNNIVVRNLGALSDTAIYEFKLDHVAESHRTLPTTSVSPIGGEVEDRVSLLATLGYELSDVDLFDGWLLLEESSAERLIREHFVRWFAPRLARVRTVAANGTGEVAGRFAALEKLFLFTHLMQVYRGKVLVLVDGDESGRAVIDRLQTQYASWPPETFVALSEPVFENYLPLEFRAVYEGLVSGTKAEMRAGKRDLLMRVLAWIDEDDNRAREAFAESASEVIARLQAFEQQFRIDRLS